MQLLEVVEQSHMLAKFNGLQTLDAFAKQTRRVCRVQIKWLRRCRNYAQKQDKANAESQAEEFSLFSWEYFLNTC